MGDEMLKDPECAARYEESMAALDKAPDAVVMFDVTIPLSTPPVALGVVAPEPKRELMQKAQEFLAQFPQTELTPKHHFAEGVYGRELFIPADQFVVGKIHKHEHLVMLMSGEATINTGDGMERMVGPRIWISPPGAKRILYTHTDCVFFTVHVTSTRDLDALEAEIIEAEPSPLPYLENRS